MPFDDSSRGPGRRPARRPGRNVLGGPIGVCSNEPMTGFFRNGCCETSPEDIGSHTIQHRLGRMPAGVIHRR
jgi:uncharacterized protein (DUF2237 family)